MSTPKHRNGNVSHTQEAPIVSQCQHLLRPNGSILGREVAEVILPRFPDLISTIPNEALPSHAALSCIDGRASLPHFRIRAFVTEIGHALRTMQVGRGRRVAVVLPNGPELALAILAVSTWASCVPLNAFGATAELEWDVFNAGVDVVIGLQQDHAPSEIAQLAARMNLPFCGLVPNVAEAGVFILIPPQTEVSVTPRNTFLEPKKSDQSTEKAGLLPSLPQDSTSADPRFLPNQHDDEVLVLFTSGTTGSKKLVPHVLADLLVATACIAVSWGLTPADTNCNLMPLFHVGGIIRQVFSPILSGGCVICCPSFEPTLFWSLCQKGAFTWYYAAPTMHQIILQSRESNTPVKLRMIANAAGGLLPSLARELRHVFGANVLPSYGMTECMPITSPPGNYQLEKPGTSGVAVGPEVAILNLDTLEPLQVGKEGPICVRSEPCFRGYGILCAGSTVPEQPVSFLKNSKWFNTGGLGYMDGDGYIYITGRAKEVINRGGEIIAPLEVEEAVNLHPDVQTCVAFSTKHSILQEVVGLVLVPSLDRPRIDLPTLHSFLHGRLAAPKWPQCLVYMDALPKSHTNKLLRVKLGTRLCLPEIHDSMATVERTFTVNCPPQGTAVSVAIPCVRVAIDAGKVEHILQSALVGPADQSLMVVPHPNKICALVVYVRNLDRMAVVKAAQERLDAYLVPGHVCYLPPQGEEMPPPQPSDALASILQEASSKGRGPTDPLVMELQELFQVLLDLDCLPAPETNFFHLGGSSMLASQLASKIRKLHKVPFGGAEIFHFACCQDIADVIRQRKDLASGCSESQTDPASSMAASSLYSRKFDLSRTPLDPTRIDGSSGWWATIFQLVPLCILYPMFQLTRVLLFFRCLLSILHRTPGERNMYKFVLTLVLFHGTWVAFVPLVFVIVKWTIIGTYRPGRYQLWGEYYLRWWFVDVLRKMIGRGIWGSNEVSLNFYYRMLGAKIGRNARISLQADLAEFDLISIGSNAAVEYATVRAFGVDNGCMILGPVEIGCSASVSARSVVAPHTVVPDGCHVPAVSSSYEVIGSESTEHVRYNRQNFPQPSSWSQALICTPIVGLVETLSHMPALFVFYWMVTMPWHANYARFETVSDVMRWICDPRRIPFFLGIRLARSTVAPLVHMMCALLVKWFVIGKFEPGPRDTTSEWQLCRHFLAATLFSREQIQEVTDVIGRHYEGVSALYRMLGAKVGERVFWPGHQPLFTGEFDLLEIGDDVVFGSRACVFCTTVDSCEGVVFCAGSNVSDNTVVLPGAVLGKNAVLGSNTVCPPGRYLPEASVWLGSRQGEPALLEIGTEVFDGPVMADQLDHSLLQMHGDETTVRPFGKAVYLRETTYFVWPTLLIVAYTVVVRVWIAILHSMPMLGAFYLGAGYLYGGWSFQHVSMSSMYTVILWFFFITHFAQIMIWLAMEVVSKWFFMGKRQVGRYNWDTSTYGQNWELYQLICQARSAGRMNILDFLSGTPFMVSFFRMLGSDIGKDSCLYPSGGDPYMPEPDLVVMGDRCVVDCASMVCHLNTRGNFELAKIVLESNVTLRTRSRIQQGVHVEQGAMLMEKALAMTGEVIEADSVWLGSPASRYISYDNTSSLGTRSFHSQQDGYRYV